MWNNLKKYLLFWLISLVLLSLSFVFFISKQEKIFVVLPHHNLVDSEIDKYYSQLSQKYWNFKNIVIISPNHFWTENNVWFPEESNYCYQKDCLTWEKLDFLKESKKIFKKNKNWNYDFGEHWVWNHFKFIKKYFSGSKIFAVILKINPDFKDEELFQNLKDYKFSWKTLFIASVDFSHHVNEKMAIFHDLKTFSFLNSSLNSQIEVDCPNCLVLMRKLALASWKKYFNLEKRTSVDTFLKINSNFENTTHFYWEFEDKAKISNIFKNNLNYQKDFTFSIFPDFLDLKTQDFEQNLKCFYSHKDLKKKPNFWFNRFFYSVDLNILQLKDETCKSLKKEDYLALKSVWFNYFCEEKTNLENIFIVNFDSNNSDFSQILKEISKNKSKKIIIFAKKIKENELNKLIKARVDIIFTDEIYENKYKKIENTTIFTKLDKYAVFLHFWKELKFDFMDFEMKNWIIDCESFK